MFRNMVSFYGEEFLAHGPTPKPEDHHLSVVGDYLFCIFLVTLHIWVVLPSAPWGRVMPWWQDPTYDELRSTFFPICLSLIILSLATTYSEGLVSLINESI